MQLSGLTLSQAQSTVLATRPYPVNLILLNSMRFQDDGTAFVDALESRQTPFGILHLNCREENHNREGGDQICLTGTVLQRLFQTNTIERLEMHGSLDDDDMLPHLISSSIKNVFWQSSTRNWIRQQMDIQPGKVSFTVRA